MGKIKVNKNKPPLSRLDKAIIYPTAVLSLPLMGLLLYFDMYLLPRIVANLFDPPFIAVYGRGIGFLFPLTFALPLTVAIISWKMISKKQPLFGNKSYKPKGLKPLYPVYPIVSKGFYNNLSPKKQKKLKITAIVLLTCLAICTLLFPFGILPRNVLDEDHVFYSYDSFNQLMHSASAEQAEKLTIEVYRSMGSGRHGRTHYYVTLTIHFEDRSYQFDDRNFNTLSDKKILEQMLELKGFFDEGEYEIKGLEYKDELFQKKNYSSTEKALFYQLFDYDG